MRKDSVPIRDDGSSALDARGGKEQAKNLTIKRDSYKPTLSNGTGEEKPVQTRSGDKQGYSPVLMCTSEMQFPF